MNSALEGINSNPRACSKLYPHLKGIAEQLVELEQSNASAERFRWNETFFLNLSQLITVGVKGSSHFTERRIAIFHVLVSICSYLPGVPIIVADEADAVRSPCSVLWLKLGEGAGLSEGRNAIVRATTTPFLLILDDDVRLHKSSSIEKLMAVLVNDPSVALASGCLFDPTLASVPGVDDNLKCDAYLYRTELGGRIVKTEALEDLGDDASCRGAHTATNFFLGRTSVLAKFGWDHRQKLGERESFYFGLFLNAQRVVVCPSVTALHSPHADIGQRSREYITRDLRYRVSRYQQYFCKNFPSVTYFKSTYRDIDCARREICEPVWSAEFVHSQPKRCLPMFWEEHDDYSVWPQPIMSHRASARGRVPIPHVPLFFLVHTTPLNTWRRGQLRQAWLQRSWFASNRGERLVPWSYVFVMSVDANATIIAPSRASYRLGDLIVVQARNAAMCAYRKLVYKTIASLEWALSHVHFEILVKCDDDSAIHVSRLWQWLLRYGQENWPNAYAGNIMRDNAVLRIAKESSTNTIRNIKWGVDTSEFPNETWPSYASGGAYILGHNMARLLTREAHHMPTFLPVEDAFLGVLANRLGVAPVHIPQIVDYKLRQRDIPIKASIVQHPIHIWRNATYFISQQSTNVAHDEPIVASVNLPHLNKPSQYIADGCDCARRVIPLCMVKRDTMHGCWTTCCIQWSATPRAPQRYLILTEATSASTSLCWALNQHANIQCNYEMMSNTARQGRWSTKGLHELVLGHERLLGDMSVWNSTSRFGRDCYTWLNHSLKLYWQHYCFTKACGFTIFQEHMYCNLEESLSSQKPRALEALKQYLIHATPEVKIIFLERRDPQAAHRSYVKAMTTDEWYRAPSARARSRGQLRNCSSVSKPDSYMRYLCGQLNLNHKLSDYLEKRNTWSRFVWDLGQGHGLDVLHMNTEDLLLKSMHISNGSADLHLNVTHLNSIAVFLGVEPIFEQVLDRTHTNKFLEDSRWKIEDKDPLLWIWNAEKRILLDIGQNQSRQPLHDTLWYWWRMRGRFGQLLRHVNFKSKSNAPVASRDILGCANCAVDGRFRLAGADLKALSAPSVAVCNQHCERHAKCYAYTFIFGQKSCKLACWLKGAAFYHNVEHSDHTISGVRRAPPGMQSFSPQSMVIKFMERSIPVMANGTPVSFSA